MAALSVADRKVDTAAASLINSVRDLADVAKRLANDDLCRRGREIDHAQAQAVLRTFIHHELAFREALADRLGMPRDRQADDDDHLIDAFNVAYHRLFDAELQSEAA